MINGAFCAGVMGNDAVFFAYREVVTFAKILQLVEVLLLGASFSCR